MKHQYGKKMVKDFWYYWDKFCKFLFTPKTRWIKNTILVYSGKRNLHNRATVETGLNRRERRARKKGKLLKAL